MVRDRVKNKVRVEVKVRVSGRVSLAFNQYNFINHHLK